MIDCLVPVLRRAQNAQPLAESWAAHCGPLDELHFICSPGDSEQIEACLQTGQDTMIVDWRADVADYAKKMNHGFEHTERPWVFLGADDIEFRHGWIEEAFLADPTADVIATNDMANGQVKRGEFGTHCLVRRTYVEDQGASADGPGVLLHEGYDHNYPDRELCGLARHRGVYAFARNARVRHKHPLWKTAQSDATYRKALRNFQQDREIFLTRAHLWDYAGLRGSERMAARRKRRDIVRTR